MVVHGRDDGTACRETGNCNEATKELPMKVFLSCVSSEFRSYCLRLANQLGALKGQPHDGKVQEDFEQGGFTLLDKLAEYVLECELVILLIGGACGARPTAEHVRTMFAHLGVPTPEPHRSKVIQETPKSAFAGSARAR
jgi:hypothetical protein